MVTEALIIRAKTWKHPIDRRKDKEDVVHMCNAIILSHKKERNDVICSNMDGPRDYHIKWSKSDKDKISLICGILKVI